MKGKKILYSTWMKAVAFAVCVVTAAAVVGEVCKAVSEMRNGSEYRPGESFEESDVLLRKLSIGVQTLADAITDESSSEVLTEPGSTHQDLSIMQKISRQAE